ncbi:MAG TPA: SRPBCC family protein [Candidatus Dormibacteraeota bacterium]|nr:SRPBCC family protein [Candidatus Dormibacteraeota bacterium]
MGERYDFEDVWTVPAPIEIAWRMIDDVATWPKWWPDYRHAEVISKTSHGPGTRWRVKVRSNLPYTLAFEFTVLAHDRPRFVKVHTEGFFEGDVDWRLEEIGPKTTRLVLHEQTETRWPLINLTARLGGRKLLEWNHRTAMRRGEAGMKAALVGGYLPPDLDEVSNPRPIG